MSERYGDCPACRGMGTVIDPDSLEKRECGRCQGTGFDGSADAWPGRSS